MRLGSDQFNAALTRNLAELQRAIVNLETMTGIEEAAGGSLASRFLEICYKALFNDYVAHCCKAFEHRSDRVATFWTIREQSEGLVDEVATREDIDMASIEAVSIKLKAIRDKTHFHIDRAGMLDTRSVWKEAGLKRSELASATRGAWRILNVLRRERGLPEMGLPDFDSSDSKRIATAIIDGRV
jgi:hypothetical protein